MYAIAEIGSIRSASSRNARGILQKSALQRNTLQRGTLQSTIPKDTFPGFRGRKITVSITYRAPYAQQLSQDTGQTGIQIKQETGAAFQDGKYIITIIYKKRRGTIIGHESPFMKLYPVSLVIYLYFAYEPLVPGAFMDRHRKYLHTGRGSYARPRTIRLFLEIFTRLDSDGAVLRHHGKITYRGKISRGKQCLGCLDTHSRIGTA